MSIRMNPSSMSQSHYGYGHYIMWYINRISSVFSTRWICYNTMRFYSNERLKAVVPSSYNTQQQEVVDNITFLLEKRIRPIVLQDGGDVEFVSYDPQTGNVYVRLSGACVGCIQSDITLKHMIQGMLCHYIDDVVAVYNCDEHGYITNNNEDSEI